MLSQHRPRVEPHGGPAHGGPAHRGPAHGGLTHSGPAHGGPAHGGLAPPQRQQHELYVLSGAPSPQQCQKMTRALRYVLESLPALNEMGVTVKAIAVPTAKLAGASGVKQFPALVTPRGDVYLGLEEIAEVYEKNKQSYMTWRAGAAQAAKKAAASPEEELAAFYHEGMSGMVNDDADEDLSGGDARGMMDAYRDATSRRGGQPGRGGRQTGGGRQGRPPTAGDTRRDTHRGRDVEAANAHIPAAPPRADNVGDEDMGGMGDVNPADDLMFAAYWENQEESM